jgi:hypothetical protein
MGKFMSHFLLIWFSMKVKKPLFFAIAFCMLFEGFCGLFEGFLKGFTFFCVFCSHFESFLKVFLMISRDFCNGVIWQKLAVI